MRKGVKRDGEGGKVRDDEGQREPGKKGREIVEQQKKEGKRTEDGMGAKLELRRDRENGGRKG